MLVAEALQHRRAAAQFIHVSAAEGVQYKFNSKPFFHIICGSLLCVMTVPESYLPLVSPASAGNCKSAADSMPAFLPWHIMMTCTLPAAPSKKGGGQWELL